MRNYQGQHLPIVEPARPWSTYCRDAKDRRDRQKANHSENRAGWQVGRCKSQQFLFFRHRRTRRTSSVHELAVQRGKRQQVIVNNLTAESGKTYYFSTRITGDGREGYSFDLVKIDSAEARLLIARSPIIFRVRRNNNSTRTRNISPAVGSRVWRAEKYSLRTEYLRRRFPGRAARLIADRPAFHIRIRGTPPPPKPPPCDEAPALAPAAAPSARPPSMRKLLATMSKLVRFWPSLSCHSRD